MNAPAVSIIMPVYKAEAFLEDSVGSVLAQSSDDWELICFNDASPDGSLDLLRRLQAAASGRMRIIDSPVNVRQGGRNRCLREARGRYVMFLDADDALAPDAVARFCKKPRGAQIWWCSTMSDEDRALASVSSAMMPPRCPARTCGGALSNARRPSGRPCTSAA